MIKINDSESLIRKVFNYDVILVGIGTDNGTKHGFPLDIGLNFPELRKAVNTTPYCDARKLGTVFEHEYNGTVFCFCFVHRGGYSKRSKDEPFINYEALTKCLKTISDKYPSKKIASKLIGSELHDGNGDKEKIISIFESELKDNDVDIYTLFEEDITLIASRQIIANRRAWDNREIDHDTYERENSRMDWISKHGVLTPMPENYRFKRHKPIRVKKVDLKKEK